MTRDEALAKGLEVRDTSHSMKRRTPWHDYRLKGTYMVTLVVEGRRPLFGRLMPPPTAEGPAIKEGRLMPPPTAEGPAATVPLGSPKGSSPSAPAIKEGQGAYVELSPLGRAIEEVELKKIHHYYPQVEVWKACIMPDHLHLILRVQEDLPEGKTLGTVVSGFKAGCSMAWWRLTEAPSAASAPSQPAPSAPSQPTPSQPAPSAASQPTPSREREGTVASVAPVAPAAATVPLGSPKGSSTPPATAAPAAATAAAAFATAAPAAPALAPAAAAPATAVERRPVLFEAGYNDKILLREGQLGNWKHYLDDNPRRLFMKQQNPRLFTVLHDLEVAGRQCQVVGNRFLLDIPDKAAVIVHRRYTDADNARLRAEWLACGERGGVLVSAAIAPKEKEVLREALERGYRIILLRENGFPELYKPAGESFDACVEGRLLQVSPWAFHMERQTITRAQCLELNAMAERLAAEDLPPYGE